LAVLKGRQKLIEDLVGIQGGKCLSTATFRAGAFFIRTRG
jgi:hypothetical protein